MFYWSWDIQDLKQLTKQLHSKLGDFKIYKMSKEEQQEIINNDDPEVGYIYN